MADTDPATQGTTTPTDPGTEEAPKKTRKTTSVFPNLNSTQKQTTT